MNPRGWVRKCEQYFELCPIHEEYKVSYASVHFDAQAECWYAAYSKPLGRVGWEQFVRDLFARFSLTNGISVMGDFNRLVQTGSVDDYFNQFESMRAQVVQEFDYLDEGYFCASFIGGLKPEIRSRVEQFEVNSFLKAILIARREEVAIQNLFKTHKPMPSANLNFNHTKPNPLLSGTSAPSSFSKPPLQPSRHPINPNPSSFQRGLLPTPPRPPPRTNLLSTDEHQRRITQGLCFRCGASFTPGHKSNCPMRTIAMIISEDEEILGGNVVAVTAPVMDSDGGGFSMIGVGCGGYNVVGNDGSNEEDGG
ncbi:hypothetical protein RJ640_000356 [Escallonia rubra]|uniref:Ty3 transposon capsid-like protein domain-containing protein n=1 Tax=Escallonia rubra TaxID=112253 RepID=A0AA88R0U7_9ASTE|nr:hypothetical protein RJ640_000356 [Escallonia rubra]